MDSECTFKPMIIVGRQSVKENDVSRSHNIERQIRHFQERKRTRKDKTTEQVDYEKSKDQCTFKPAISSFKFSQSGSENRKVSKEDRSQSKRKQQSKSLVSTRCDGGKRKTTIKEYSFHDAIEDTASQIEPLLVANIQIGQDSQTAKLVIYDTSDIPDVVAKFCVKHCK